MSQHSGQVTWQETAKRRRVAFFSAIGLLTGLATFWLGTNLPSELALIWQVLVLLPEIALTESFLKRFEARFGVAPVTWASSGPASGIPCGVAVRLVVFAEGVGTAVAVGAADGPGTRRAAPRRAPGWKPAHCWSWAGES